MPAPTPQQQRAIDATGDVLVMAGAGAGKTSTLVARILNRVLDAPERVAVDRLLVVTFNEAAAAELRHRLRIELERRQEAAPEDPFVPEALARLETAQVSTLHAFCLRLLREHFHDVGLDPQFGVQDEVQSAILRRQVLDEVFRAHYRGDAPESESVRAFLARHAAEGDEGVRALVLRTAEYARTLAGTEAWLARLRRTAEETEPVRWREWLVPGLTEWARSWIDPVDEIAAADATNVPAAECARRLASMAGRAGAAGSGVPFPPAGDGNGAGNGGPVALLLADLEALCGWGEDPHYPRGKKGTWRKPLEKLFAEADEVRALLVPVRTGDRDPLAEDWAWARADLRALLELVAQFARRFADAKRAVAVVDFSDLEQLALRLLWDEEKAAPTALAQAWRSRLEHVFVDEYQDINEVQDRLLSCLGRSGERANRFLVGDVKQSIYRFRRADPRIFQRYARDWRNGEGAARESGPSTVIPLSENFRSHRAILEFVNELFDGLMRESIGGVRYDAEARLVYGAAASRPALQERPEHRVELHLLVADAAGAGAAGDGEAGADGEGGGTGAGSAAGTGEDLDAEEAQAAIAARRLKALHDTGLELWDGGSGRYRPVSWADMVVLHPAPRPVAERWARQFTRAGVPLEARRGGFFEAQEIGDLVNLVRILDNPLQDLPLLAVLRSPLVGMTADELAAIRLVTRPAPYWEALEQFASGVAFPAEVEADPVWRAAGVSARVKAQAFREDYGRWRRIGQEGSLAWCLETALTDTSYEAWIRSGTRSEARLANVRRLLAMSRQFDQFQRHGVFRFLRFLEAQEEAGQETESAPAAVGDAVRLLSVHQSKGLEFPVVVVAGLGRRFNFRDIQAEWLLDEEYGVCPPVLPPGRLRGYPSFARWLAGRRQRREAVGEQIRLFYVACTRAAERLILLGSTREKRLAEWAVARPHLGERDLLQGAEPLAWLGPGLARLTGERDWTTRESGCGRWLDWTLHRSPAPAVATEEPVALDSEIPDDLVARIRASLGWSYPWPGATVEPAKAAVTALRRRWAEADPEAVARDAHPAETPAGGWAASPSNDAIERGLAHHLFCELVRLEATASREELGTEVERLAAEGWLRPEQVAVLDLDGLAGFWVSEMGDRVRARADCVQRELPFTVRLGPQDFARLGPAAAVSAAAGFAEDDFQVVQGVADLTVILPDEIWVVDYKTDRVTGEALERRAEAYRMQLRLYAHALSAIYRRPVTERWLYFVHARRLVAVEPA